MANARPLVSVVVPTFNQGHYLPMALDSVLFQDYPEVEMIVSNFGSTDDTSDVIKRYLHDVEHERVSYLACMEEDGGQERFLRREELRFPQGRRIKVLDSQVNIGGTAAYNAGFRECTGQYCMYLVGDDYLLPHALSRMVDALEREAADVAYADMFVVDDAGRILQKLAKPDWSFKACLADWFHLGVCRLYRRELHERFGYYDENYRNANDYDMFLRLAQGGCSFIHVPEVLYCTRIHHKDGQNEPANWRNDGYNNLLRESAGCARRARELLAGQEKP